MADDPLNADAMNSLGYMLPIAVCGCLKRSISRSAP